MARRDVSVTVCSVVVGILLGAGSVLYAQESTASATRVTFRELPSNINPQQFKSRHLPEKMIAPKVPKANTIKGRTPEAPASEGEKSLTTCELVKKIVSDLSTVILGVIPNQQNFTAIRTKVQAAFDKAVSDNCAAGAPSEAVPVKSEMKKAAPRSVDNDCGQYDPDSVRYTKCRANELLGKPYSP